MPVCPRSRTPLGSINGSRHAWSSTAPARAFTLALTVSAGLFAIPAHAGDKQKSTLPPSSYPLPPPDATPSEIFKPDLGKPFTQTGPRIEYHPGSSFNNPAAICGPGEIRGMNGRCIR